MPRPDPTFPAVVLIDTREQLPFTFDAIPADQRDGGGTWRVQTERRGIPSGDYSLDGFADRVAVERKSVADLFGTIGQGRDRFVRELERLAAFDFAAVVVEGDWREILGAYPDQLAELRQEFAGRLARKDDAAPWGRFLRLLTEATPGPPPRSQLPPRIIWRSVLAWQQRYPRVHWHPVPGREWAEMTTFRILERFLKEQAK